MPSQHLFFQSAQCPLYSSASPLSFSSSSSYQSSVSDPPFEPNSDIYYAAEQDGVYSYQPLFSVPTPWPPEPIKEKQNNQVYQENYYINGHNNIPLDVSQFDNYSQSYSVAVSQGHPHSQFPYNENNCNSNVHSTLQHPQHAQPPPTYPHPAVNYHYDDVPQDHYIRPAELSPSNDNIHYQPQPCVPQDFPEQIPDIDTDADADAEGEDEFFEQEYQDDGEPEVDVDHDAEDHSGDSEYVYRRGRASSNTLPTQHERTLRSRSASDVPITRFSPYHYSPSQTPSYSRSRSRRTSAETSVSIPAMESTLFTSTSNELQTKRRTRPVTPLPVPVPVPNLTKKSRGRRVPTVASLEFGGRARTSHCFNEDDYTDAGKRRGGTRMYTCKVAGCGKCFARGEHLKRHVRSIHTYEKPHKCPYPGCGKDFSRHDNLGQHMRVHKDYVGPTTDTGAFRI